MNQKELIQLQAKTLGYREVPVDMNTFIEDDYFMGSRCGNGKLFPYWKKFLLHAYPTPILQRYPFLMLTGALGTGKSLCSKVISLYNLYKLSCLNSYEDTFKLIQSKPITLVYGAEHQSQANSALINSIRELMKESPFFNREFNETGLQLMPTGTKYDPELGEECIFYHWNEINFWRCREEKALRKVDQSFDRLNSRFLSFENFFGGIVIDCSTGEGEETRTDKIKYKLPKFKVIRPSIWEAKGHTGIYFRKGSFKVFIGSKTHRPFILHGAETEEELAELDPDRIIEVPMELYDSYYSNIELAITNSSGYSLSYCDEFFRDKSVITRNTRADDHTFGEIDLDFYDSSSLVELLADKLKLLNDWTPYVISIDNGLAKDTTGLAVSHIEGMEIDNDRVVEPFLYNDFNISISRKSFQTSMNKVMDFIIHLHNNYIIETVTMDTFQSFWYRQQCELNKINVKFVSVDRTPDAYLLLKKLLTEDKASLYYNEKLINELKALLYINNKVDHPEDGSKDLGDAVAQSFFTLYQLAEKLVGSAKNYYSERAKTKKDTRNPKLLYEGLDF